MTPKTITSTKSGLKCQVYLFITCLIGAWGNYCTSVHAYVYQIKSFNWQRNLDVDLWEPQAFETTLTFEPKVKVAQIRKVCTIEYDKVV